MSDSLRSKVIRLAHANPDLRGHLLPLLTKRSSKDPSEHTKKTYEFLEKELGLSSADLARDYPFTSTEDLNKMSPKEQKAWSEHLSKWFEEDQKERLELKQKSHKSKETAQKLLGSSRRPATKEWMQEVVDLFKSNKLYLPKGNYLRSLYDIWDKDPDRVFNDWKGRMPEIQKGLKEIVKRRGNPDTNWGLRGKYKDR